MLNALAMSFWVEDLNVMGQADSLERLGCM